MSIIITFNYNLFCSCNYLENYFDNNLYFRFCSYNYSEIVDYLLKEKSISCYKIHFPLSNLSLNILHYYNITFNNNNYVYEKE